MKTDQLISALAADEKASKPTPLGAALLLGLLPGVLISLAFYALAVGPRPHLLDLLATSPRVDFKIVYPALLFVCASALALRLVRPCANPRPFVIALILLALALAAAVVTELIVLPEDLWRVRFIGHNALVCMVLIPTMALAPLVGALFALRQGAPLNPSLAGASAGLLAGALAACLYATHCPDDSPLFVATWYGLAITLVTLAGTLAGSRILRW